ncbi:hypothetical protein TWF694_000243 [Orbilia ellipsospora]|uniref:Uncharacterized protein n=1 Tax=Orbilia ellipsospora TaxID=2528407 RepID=A0AAV9XN10_9PEZI
MNPWTPINNKTCGTRPNSERKVERVQNSTTTENMSQQKGKTVARFEGLEIEEESFSDSSNDTESSTDFEDDAKDETFRGAKPARTSSYELRSSRRSNIVTHENPKLAIDKTGISSASSSLQKFKIVWQKPRSYAYGYVLEEDMPEYLEVTPDQLQTIKAGFRQMLLREAIFVENAERLQSLNWAVKDEMCKVAMRYLPLNNEEIMTRLRVVSQKDVKGWTLWRLIMGLQKELISGTWSPDPNGELADQPKHPRPVLSKSNGVGNNSPASRFRTTYARFKNGDGVEADEVKTDSDANTDEEDTLDDVIPNRRRMRVPPPTLQACTRFEYHSSQSVTQDSPPFSPSRRSQTQETGFFHSRKSSLTNRSKSSYRLREYSDDFGKELIDNSGEERAKSCSARSQSLARELQFKSSDQRGPNFRNRTFQVPRESSNKLQRSTPRRQVEFSKNDNEREQFDDRHDHHNRRAASHPLLRNIEQQQVQPCAPGQELGGIPHWVVSGFQVGVILLWIAVLGLFLLTFSMLRLKTT